MMGRISDGTSLGNTYFDIIEKSALYRFFIKTYFLNTETLLF